MDFYHKYPKSAYPDFLKELSVFSRNPSNLEERLTLDHLLGFSLFDSKTKTAVIQEGDVTLKIVKEEFEFQIWQDGLYMKSIKVLFLEDNFRMWWCSRTSIMSIYRLEGQTSTVPRVCHR